MSFSSLTNDTLANGRSDEAHLEVFGHAIEQTLTGSANRRAAPVLDLPGRYNKVFEDFTVIALRETLRLADREFPQGAKGRAMKLDRADMVGLEPDISWWDGGRCVFVGDLKYKKTEHRRVPNADLYQLLAYTIAADLPEGLLIYAQGESDPTVHAIRHAGKRLEVMAVDLSGSPERILTEVGEVAARIRSMRRRSRRGHLAA